ncbi:hypothetical protein Trydic_g5186 [Trypoxylus dichotomus]
MRELDRRYVDRGTRFNEKIVSDHFTKVEELLERIGLKNHVPKICIMHEKGSCLGLHHQQTVLAVKVTRNMLKMLPLSHVLTQ